MSAAGAGLNRYLEFNNAARPHQAHGGLTPDVVYFSALPAIAAAA